MKPNIYAQIPNHQNGIVARKKRLKAKQLAISIKKAENFMKYTKKKD